MSYVYRNVNDAFSGLVRAFHSGSLPTTKTESRAGEVLAAINPLSITYERPLERVLFNPARDCNPFFHLFESLWMLAGRADVKPLLKYNARMKEFSDDGEVFNAAYGFRWRKQFGIDQLKRIAEHLERKPESRRAVLQMWDTYEDLGKVDWTKDVACNTHAYFSIREKNKSILDSRRWKGLNWHHISPGRKAAEEASIALVGDTSAVRFSSDSSEWFLFQDSVLHSYLDMTVCNRSNDLIWGMLGANIVHFSFLQEYMAARIGVEVGRYTQFTNNLHVYTERWTPEKYIDAEEGLEDYYDWPLATVPLVHDPEIFDEEVKEFIDDGNWTRNWREPFLQKVAAPMMWAFELHKRRDYINALKAIDSVAAEDWAIACTAWLERRKLRWEEKNNE